MNIKLPRKRKKQYIKKHGRHNYQLSVIASEVLAEDGVKNADKFPKKLARRGNRIEAISYW